MSGLDYNRIGELRIRAERAEARADRFDEIARQLEPLLRAMGTPTARRFADELLLGISWDGCPIDDRVKPGAHRRGVQT